MPSASTKPAVPSWLRALVVLAIVAFVYAAQRERVAAPPAPVAESTPVQHPPTKESSVGKVESQDKTKRDVAVDESPTSTVIKHVTLKDQSGRVIFRGDVDLQPTLDRIAAGTLLDRFPNDGSVFRNREKRLPKRSSGYYREYVVPIEGQSGPGPQRLVVGNRGDVYYTHDHYQSFRKVR